MGQVVNVLALTSLWISIYVWHNLYYMDIKYINVMELNGIANSVDIHRSMPYLPLYGNKCNDTSLYGLLPKDMDSSLWITTYI